MSLMNVADWAPGQSMPSRFDFAAQEQGQYDIEFAPAGGASPIQTTMDFVEFGRPWIDLASGGSATWTKGVNFARLLYTSSYAPEIISLYHRAGLNLNRDLDQLTRNANITADPAAVRSLEQTSVPTGRLQVPELDMHTISDQLVPVQQENYYRNTVAFAGRSQLLRQAFVQRQLHCNFEPSELVAGVLAVQHRVDTGQWDRSPRRRRSRRAPPVSPPPIQAWAPQRSSLTNPYLCPETTGRSTRSPAARSLSRRTAGRSPDLNRRLPGHNTRDAADFHPG